MEDSLLALAAAEIGTWRWAVDCARMHLSPIARQLLDDPAETGDLAAFLDCFHAEDRPALTAALDSMVTQDHAFELECRLRPGDQAETWLRIKGRRQRQEPGQAEAVRGILMAAGPRQAAERANHRLAAIVTSSDDAIVGKTVDGIITDWNPSAEIIFGYAADEVIGQSVAILAAPGREAEMPTILARIRNGERVDHYETRRRRKDGTVIDVSITVSPVFDTQGKIVGVSKVARDITLVKRAQRALAEREAFLTSVLETVPAAMIVMDEAGIVQLFSATAEGLFGYAAAEAVGRPARHLMRTDKAGGYAQQPIGRFLETQDPRSLASGGRALGVRKDGSTFPMQLVIGNARSGERHFFTAFVLDLTAQQKTQKELQELQVNLMQMSRLTALGEMASTLAHELNQPLTAIANYLQGSRMLLASGREGVLPAVREAVNQAVEQALRAGKVIRSLRDFLARGETQHKDESLPRIIEEASALALLGIREDGVAVALDLAPDADRVSCNKVQIQQVLLNLIRNAMEAMHQAPVRRLLLTSRRIGPDLVELSVHDTGHGISPEIREKLFQPFVTTKPRGMGVGLSISRTIVEAHGGRLWVEPASDGGSVFRLTLRQRAEEDRGDDL